MASVEAEDVPAAAFQEVVAGVVVHGGGRVGVPVTAGPSVLEHAPKGLASTCCQFTFTGALPNPTVSYSPSQL